MKLLTFVAALLVSTGGAAGNTKYFGYFGGDYQSVTPNVADLPEFQDHINLYSMQYWSGTSDNVPASENWVLQELEHARSLHVHAMVPAHPFVFLHSLDEKTFRYDPDAATKWNSLVQKMLDRGLLIPGDPDRSTVVATYIVDEPNGDAELNDQNGQAHPALANAVAAVRGNPATANLPIASILTPEFEDIKHGMQLLDWVGFDHYGDTDTEWTNTLNALENTYAPGKKYIIVPGAEANCPQVVVEDPTRYVKRMDSDPNVVWLAPFMWHSGGGCLGVRDLPSLKDTYRAEGLKLKNAACDASPASRWFCGKGGRIDAAISWLLDN